MTRIVEFAKANDIMLVHDFAYAEIAFDGYKPPSILEVPGARDIAIEFTSLSKSHNMAGWRVGFACGNKQMIHALKRIKSYLDYGMPQPIQIGAITALRGPQDCVTETVAVYKERRDALIDGLGQDGEGCWKIEKPLGTMFVWAPIPEKFKPMGSLEFSKRLLEGGGGRGVAGRRIRRAGRGLRALRAGREQTSDPTGGARHPALPARIEGLTRSDPEGAGGEKWRWVRRRAVESGSG